MKRIIFIAILILAFCFAVNAQTDETIPKLITEPVDKFERLTRDDLKARLDGLRLGLANDPTAEAIINIEFDQKDSRKKKVALLKMFNQCFVFTNVDESKYTFIISDSNREQTTLWLLPNGNNVIKEDSNNDRIIVIKGEKLRQVMTTIFKKKLNLYDNQH